jgi:hypothetical protein
VEPSKRCAGGLTILGPEFRHALAPITLCTARKYGISVFL